MKTFCLHLMMAFSLFFPLPSYAQAAKVLFVSGSHDNRDKTHLFETHAKEAGLTLVSQSAKNLQNLDEAKALFEQYDIVIFAAVSPRDAKNSFARYAPLVAHASNHIMTLNWREADHLHTGISKGDAATIEAYYENGGAENMRNLARFLRLRVIDDSDEDIPAPIVYPVQGFYHPQAKQKLFTTLDAYLDWAETQGTHTHNKPVVGILFQRAAIESANTALLDETIARFEAKGHLAVPFYFELSPRSKDYTPMLFKDGKVFIDAIANFRMIHWASQRKKEFETLGVPVVQALSYFGGDQQAWEKDSQGISPNMTPFQLVLPESAGVIDPIVVAATDPRSGKTEIIDYQLDHLVEKVAHLTALKHTPNAEKKLTVMIWGSQDVGASFLNIPESLRVLSNTLNREGYAIHAVNEAYFTDRIDDILEPFYREYELDRLIEEDTAELMPVSDYLAWFNTLPDAVRDPINAFWGEAKDNFMVVKRKGVPYFVLPRIRNGNMLVMRQPPRSDDPDEANRYFHKETIPMNHFYLAAYYYSREFWGADAFIHLGTHGSHEYLPGKERGLSLYDQGNLATWHTPIIYPFIVDDVGEAMQTKRRGSATVIAHMTPPFAAAGLQGDVADLHELMHQYKSLDEGGVKEKTKNQLINDCYNTKICDDLDWSRANIAADFDDFMEALHHFLEDLASQNQPLGLHTFGEAAERDLLLSTLVQMLGKDFPKAVAQFERQNTQAYHDPSHDESDSHEHEHEQASEDHHHHLNRPEIENIVGFTFLQHYVMEGNDKPKLNDVLQAYVDQAKTHFNNLSDLQEKPHFVAALEGKYIPVKTGGDPIRHPDALPTGYNLYGFDPARVPTKAAWEQGKELTANVIADYYQQHGRYPDKLAFSLWSMETMRHYGVLEAQALYAMGVRPVWSDDGRVIDTEIIPAAELKRPRVDVVLSATGLYRDAFPNVMQWLAKAIRKVSELKEAGNSMWDNSQRLKSELIAAGIDADEAEYLSSVRIFSNESGTYGSGLGDSTIASEQWEQDSRLADLYLSRMGYYYGDDNSRWGQKAPEGINLYAKTLSGTDVALFSRSSNVYGLLSSDDPFQYFGGLALAVRNIDGQSPEMYISNLRDAQHAKSEKAEQFLAKDLRSRNFHPRWLEEMKKEGYSGAVTMAANVSNFFGWQVMDPNMVRDDQWQEFFEIYVEDKLDKNLNAWFEEVDPKAQAAIIERMLEATRKQYWDASDATVKTLIERYQDLVTRFDLIVDNDKLREFVSDRAQGYGLNLNLPAPEIPAKVLAQTQQVQGQQLEKVKQSPSENDIDYALIGALAACFAIFLLGALRQSGLRFSRSLFAFERGINGGGLLRK